MFTPGVSRSEVVNVVAPERRARNAAVCGMSCMGPIAPAAESRGWNFVSA